MTQTADTKPGNYYVTAQRDDGRHAFLLGPFENDHQRALDLVPEGRRLANECGDPRACWYAYGTARAPLDFTRPGKLNGRLESDRADTGPLRRDVT